MAHPLIQRATVVHAGVVMVLSLWGFLAADKLSPTALIPVGFGIALGLCALFMAQRWGIRLAAALVLILAVALTVPLHSALEDGDVAALVRIGLMLISSGATLGVYARRTRPAA